MQHQNEAHNKHKICRFLVPGGDPVRSKMPHIKTHRCKCSTVDPRRHKLEINEENEKDKFFQNYSKDNPVISGKNK